MGADLARTQLLNKYKKGVKFLLLLSNIYSKYVWVYPLTERKSTLVIYTFQKFRISLVIKQTIMCRSGEQVLQQISEIVVA